MTEDSSVKRSLFETSYAMFSIFYSKFICIKSYIYTTGGLRVILEIQIVSLSLGFELG